MRKLALALIVIESLALIMLITFAKIQYSKAEVNAMAAFKQQQLLVREKEITTQLTEELIDCREAADTAADGQ